MFLLTYTEIHWENLAKISVAKSELEPQFSYSRGRAVKSRDIDQILPIKDHAWNIFPVELQLLFALKAV